MSETEEKKEAAAETEVNITQDRVHPIVYPITRFFCNLYYRLGGLKMYGRENIPRSGRYILATNHVSHLDAPLVSTYAPITPHIIAKRELFKHGWFGKYIANLGAFPVSRGKADRKAIRRAVEVLEKDIPLIIFPEGTRSRDGELQEAEIGIGMIAQAAKAPILPIYIKGTDQALSAVRPGFRLVKIELHYGKLIRLEEEFGDQKGRELYENLGKRVMADIAALKEQAHANS